MASANLLALIDDITTVLDDIAMMTKVAARKTAGVLGDDLALNAQQVTGVRAQRELPVVWAVALGSLKNKAILVPAALLISVIAPWLITPLLMLGGAFLCFEGAEKILHKFLHAKEHEEEHQTISSALQNPEIDFLALEREKIKGAVRTDFILSAEIIVITLGTVATASFPIQVTVMVGVALLMTVGVYGLVAGIVKLDDAGLWLSQREGDGSGAALQRALGRGVLWVAPWLMKTLSVVGTIAMFLVGGGILVHGIPWLAHLIHGIEERASSIPAVGDILAGLTPMVLNGVLGVVAGLIVVALFSLVQRLRGAKGHD